MEPTAQAAMARGKRSRQINSPLRLLLSRIPFSQSCQPSEIEPVALAKSTLATDNNSNNKISDRRNVVGIILQY